MNIGNAEMIGDVMMTSLRKFAEETREKSIAFLSITETSFNFLVNTLQLNISIAEPIPVQSTSPVFESFDWKDRDENNQEAMTEARNHLEFQLQTFGISFGRNYSLRDLHNDHACLSVHDTRFTLRGSTDFAIVPTNANSLNQAIQFCVIFEIKAKKLEKRFRYQTAAELIAARYLSRQPRVLAILTDLASYAMAYELHYDAEMSSFGIIEYEHISLSQMAIKVNEHLTNYNIPNASFTLKVNEEDATERDLGAIAFKKRKVQLQTSLELEALQDMMMDPDSWSSDEKMQLFRNFLNSTEAPASISVDTHHMMYS